MTNKSQVGVHGSEELANLPDKHNTVKAQTGGHNEPSTLSLGDPIYPHNGPFAHGGPVGDMQRDGMVTIEQQRKLQQELSEYEILEGNKQDYFSETEKEIIREVRFSENYAKLKGNAE
jgi:hypothetical protein